MTVREGTSWREVLAENERRPFAIEEGEWMRHTLIPNESGAQWVLVAHHLEGDGISMLYFARDVLSAMANKAGADYTILPVRLPEARDLPKGARLSPFIALMVRALNREWEKGKRIFTFEDRRRLHDAFWKDRQTQVLLGEIGGDALSGLLSKCHAHKVTLTAAMATAFLLSAPGETDVGLAVSIRPKGFEGMGNYASGISIRHAFDPRKDFWANAAVVHRLMREKLNHPKRKYFLLCFMNGLSPSLIDAAYYSAYGGFANDNAARVSRMFGYSGNGKGISLTNLTIAPIPDLYGHVKLESIVCVPPLVPNAKRILGVVTIGGRMIITMQYRKDQEENQAIFQKAVDRITSLS